MINLHLSGAANESFQILWLGSNSDDIEVGCGATVSEDYPGCVFYSVVFSTTGYGQRRPGVLRKC